MLLAKYYSLLFLEYFHTILLSPAEDYHYAVSQVTS